MWRPSPCLPLLFPLSPSPPPPPPSLTVPTYFPHTLCTRGMDIGQDSPLLSWLSFPDHFFLFPRKSWLNCSQSSGIIEWGGLASCCCWGGSGLWDKQKECSPADEPEAWRPAFQAEWSTWGKACLDLPPTLPRSWDLENMWAGLGTQQISIHGLCFRRILNQFFLNPAFFQIIISL